MRPLSNLIYIYKDEEFHILTAHDYTSRKHLLKLFHKVRRDWPKKVSPKCPIWSSQRIVKIIALKSFLAIISPSFTDSALL